MAIGDTEYTYYQSKGYDLMHVWGRLAVYKKKILTRATLKESIYTLEEDVCKIRFQRASKKAGKKESKRDKMKRD